MKNLKTMVFLLILLSVFFNANLYSQELDYRDIEYYFEIQDSLEIIELKKEGLIDDSLMVVEKYREVGEEHFNQEAFMKYAEIKMNVMLSMYKDYLYQQHIYYSDDVYVLYFSIAGYDDVQWQILKFEKSVWDKKDKIDGRLVEDCKYDPENPEKCIFTPIVFNYDEGPKNLENVKMFIKNDYLVLERGGLYHSLFDLKNQKVLLNEESPWSASDGKEADELNLWIKENLHDKIEQVITK